MKLEFYKLVSKTEKQKLQRKNQVCNTKLM